ncbi:hypothetical protein [Pseudoxanthomonas sp.]|uniref:hypothetical protein n=1 Tax=Pseudoxanthomonas sp. TaxID=1871049 RepID=UPI003F803268
MANWEAHGDIAPTVGHRLKLARLTGVDFERLAAEDVVRDGDERWLLQLFREVPKRQRPLLLDVIEVHARKRQA